MLSPIIFSPSFLKETFKVIYPFLSNDLVGLITFSYAMFPISIMVHDLSHELFIYFKNHPSQYFIQVLFVTGFSLDYVIVVRECDMHAIQHLKYVKYVVWSMFINVPQMYVCWCVCVCIHYIHTCIMYISCVSNITLFIWNLCYWLYTSLGLLHLPGGLNLLALCAYFLFY